MRRFLSLDELTAAPGQGETFAVAGRLLGPPLEDRCIRYCFSDASVGRDMHTIASDAWDLTNFQRNPVFLWAHLDDELPVGRVENLATEAGRLVGQVRYADHAFADTVYQLVKGNFLNATSTGWLPLEWRAAKDRARPGGLDFTRVELLEISQVPVPALPTALVTARSAGIDTRPLFDWAERLLDQGNFAVIGKPELENLRKAARMPVPKSKTAPPAPERDFAGLSRKFKQRDLFAVADLCYFLAGAENLFDRVAAEAAREEDGSELPAKLRAWLDDGNRLLLAMAGEETAEQIAGTQDDGGPYYWSAATLEQAVARALEKTGLVRKGAKFSAETMRCMRAVHGHIQKAHKQLSDLLDDGDDANPEDNADDPGVDPDDDDSERRAREAKERLAKAQAVRARIGA
jgi:HK97 family phage prohead protease